MRWALLVAVALAGCGEERAAPAPEAPNATPAEHPERVGGAPAFVAAIDDARVIILSHVDGRHPRLSLFADGAPAWSQPLRCATNDWTNIALTAAADLTTVRCRIGREVWTLAYETESGEQRWTGGAAPAGELAMDAVYSRRHGNYLVESRSGGAVRVLRASDGEQVWEANEHVRARRWTVDGVLTDGETDLGFRRLAEATRHTLGDALPLGAFDSGVCLYRDGAVVHWRPEGERTLVTEEALGSVGARIGAPGLLTRCARRESSTVLLVDADSHLVLAAFAEDGSPRWQLRLPPSSGPPDVAGWERPLPRHLPIPSRACRVSIVDLDAGRVTGTVPLGACSGGGYALLGVRWRTEDLFWMTSELRLLALEGESGRFLAIEPTLDLDGPTLDRALSGDAVWLARGGDAIEVERAALAGAHENAFARQVTARFEPAQASTGVQD